MTLEQLWYTLCGLLALAAARLLNRYLPPIGMTHETPPAVAPPPAVETAELPDYQIRSDPDR